MMTVTATSGASESTKTQAGVGRVVRVIGPVVDAEFPRDAMPDIYNALHVEVTLSGGTKTLTLEVAQHLGDNIVRASRCSRPTAWSGGPRSPTPARRSRCPSAT